jgi:hypothetical protein
MSEGIHRCIVAAFRGVVVDAPVDEIPGISIVSSPVGRSLIPDTGSLYEAVLEGEKNYSTNGIQNFKSESDKTGWSKLLTGSTSNCFTIPVWYSSSVEFVRESLYQ